ncbi:unnamed protein product, partial [Effrenium voratum]
DIMEKQMNLMSCIVESRSRERPSFPCRLLLERRRGFVSAATDMALDFLPEWPPPLTPNCSKHIRGQSPDRKTCGTNVLLQLVLKRDVVTRRVYISKAGGLPNKDWQDRFLEAYDQMKNRAGGDDLQARVVLRSDIFGETLGTTFAAHSSVFRD